VIREQTVKSVLVIIPKLSDRTINGELLRHLAKTANDDQAGIRTNTTICLGKIARNLGTAVGCFLPTPVLYVLMSSVANKSLDSCFWTSVARSLRTCAECCPIGFGRHF
jgi:hypothetical protein